MSDTSTLLLVIMAAVLVSMVLAIVIVRRSQVRASRALADLGGATLTTAATGMGMSGVDAPPLRGTGTLALTDTDVAFAQWRPEHLLRIPRSAITGIEATREHLDRTLKTDVLRITWREPGAGGGAERSVAFFIRDLDPWLAALA
ncbi:MAG TPA: hypothetical protein VIR58_15265 [Acidimicrobiales bacterium]